jgi:hypothetical protein
MSLETAWIVMVGLLLVVGTLVWGDEPEPDAEEEFGRDEAIAAIEKLGGTCRCDVLSPDSPIVRVGLRHTQVTDASLEYLKVLTSLQKLDLGITRVTDAGMRHLKGLTSLQELNLHDTHVTDAGVNELKKALPNCTIVH